MFWQTGSCFEKLICVLRNRFVFWEINLCFGKLICVLGNCFFLGVNGFVIDPFGTP